MNTGKNTGGHRRERARRAVVKRKAQTPLAKLLAETDTTAIDGVTALQSFLSKITVAIAVSPSITPDETRKIKLVMQLARQLRELTDIGAMEEEIRKLRAIIAGNSEKIAPEGPQLESVADERTSEAGSIVATFPTLRGRPRKRALA